MRKTIEQKILVSVPEGAKNIRTRIVDGKVEISYNLYPATEEKNYEEYFSLVEASKYSLDDELLQQEYSDSLRKSRKFKQVEFLEKIKHYLEFEERKDFKAPCLDPSVDKKTKKIYYKPGSKPGVGYSAIWWNENAKKVMPRLRQGLTYEREIFLFSLVKRGLATLEQVSEHSEEIGHYWDSENAKQEFETTGSRPIGEFCDLANTCKITAKDKEASGFSLGGGGCYDYGRDYPLTGCDDVFYPGNDCCYGGGWLVLDCDTEH